MPGTGPTLDAEWSILRTACSQLSRRQRTERLRALLGEPPRWKILFDLAERHGAQPLLYQALVDVEDVVPSAQRSALERYYQINLHKALFLSRELIRIVEHLAAANIPVMPYKGLALAELAYRDLALRHAGDIDLLVLPQDVPRTLVAIRELGYSPHLSLNQAEERAYLKSGYELAFDGPAGPNLLEVQWAIQPGFYAVDFDMAALFQRATTVNVAGHAMQTPSAADLFLLLSAHAAKHVWGRLIWLCDIARVMSFESLDWNWIGSHASTLGLVRLLRVTLLLTNRILEAPIPPAAQLGFPEDPVAEALADEIQAHLASQATFNVESLAYFRLMMRLRERPADRLRFLQRLALTPGPSEWQAVRLPAPLFPLYRVVRLSRLAARLVRS